MAARSHAYRHSTPDHYAEIKGQIGMINVRLDGIDARFDGVNARIDDTNTRIDALKSELKSDAAEREARLREERKEGEARLHRERMEGEARLREERKEFITNQRWFMGTTLTILALIMTAFGLWMQWNFSNFSNAQNAQGNAAFSYVADEDGGGAVVAPGD